MSNRNHSSEPRPNNWRNRGPTDANRTRGRAGQALRARIAERDGYQCQPCKRAGRPARRFDQVDHMTPIAKGGTDDDTNLECICAQCHDEKTRRENGWKPAKPTIGLDGWPEP